MARTIWHIENYDEAIKRKIKAFAGSNGYTIPEALTQIIAEWEALKAQDEAREKSQEDAKVSLS